ncbi:uncharacterized protein LOC110101988 [Dendrobium catenatum]|uniref:uncharacterized protein LOC110101988 n=1 Tax=Dendrobium catenatum TaxID=906689 RepID=UPI0009F5128C|nr:uncharacterized protein LOC110101988 [Dendrobium catenatum]
MVKHLSRIASDHCTILLEIFKPVVVNNKEIRYEEVWATYLGAEAIVKKSWSKYVGMDPASSLNVKFKRTLRSLFFWSKAKFKNLIFLWDKLKEEIQEVQLEEGEVGISFEKLQILRFKINELNITLARLNTWWKQRAKARKNTNWISHIKTNNCSLTEDGYEIQKVFFEFFKLKWKHRHCMLEGWPKTSVIINEKDQYVLEAEFTKEELQSIIEKSGSNIAPGLDGITFSFLKNFWKLIADDVWIAVSQFMSSGELHMSWKETLIVLIPKTQNPQEVTNYQPISFCLTIYKVIAKKLLSRLEMVIHKLISADQAAFIKGRSLSDHVLLAQEVFNKFCYSKARKGLLAIKLDMEQAYDSMGWEALRQVLSHFNFPSKFKELILQCILDPKYCFLINGRKTNLIEGNVDLDKATLYALICLFYALKSYLMHYMVGKGM